MNATVELELMRASAQLDQAPAVALRAASAIVARYPGHEGASLLFATASRRVGDPAMAVAVLEPLVASNPDVPLLRLELGRAFGGAGDDARAREQMEAALALDPKLAEAWRELSLLRHRAGDERGCDLAYLEYAKLSTAPAALADAAVALAEGRTDTAAAMLRAHLEAQPRDADALRMLADAESRQNDTLAAERHLLAALEIAPGYGAARYDLARLLNSQQRSAEALVLLDRLLLAEPASRAFRVLKAQALRFVERSEEAVAIMDAVIADNPRDPTSLVVFGHLLREVGDQARAIDAYRRALQLEPSSGEAYWALANLKTFRFSAEDEQALRLEIARAPALGMNRTRLEFALGKALEDTGRHEESFSHYEHANGLYRGTIDYSAEVITDDVRRSEALFTPRFFAERAGWGLADDAPIFVVGVPRSGSTLIEQILSSHSLVEGTRELPYLTQIVRDLAVRAYDGGQTDYPGIIGTLDRAEVESLARRYLAEVAPHRPLGRPRFVDKMLSNFGHVGLIHLMFPNATIIDARRHPMACGFSCFKQLFPRGIHFCYDLEETGLYWRDYHELMDHYDAVLPDRVYRVHYERLVSDPEAEVRRILDHCRLPFEDRCLRFYENSRKVMTVSSEQVRQPIYAEGIDQWRKFEPWLGRLAGALGPLATDYPVFPAPGG